MIERSDEISRLNTEIMNIIKSTSWRITVLLRIAKNLVVSPKREVYSILRSLFWKLPAGLRQALHGQRHAFVRIVRGMPQQRFPRNINVVTTDISWRQFKCQVLSRRANYKGIFIQEMVIDWNSPLYQRPQHLSTALGALGYLVIYRTDNFAGDAVSGFREVTKNVWITNRYEIEKIQDVVRSFYSTSSVNTPESLLRKGRRGVLVYEYVDHIHPDISGDQENIERLLRLKNFAFSGGADFIVASSRKLYEEAVESVGRDKVILVPNGVDTAHYQNSIHRRTPLPSVLIEFKQKHKAVVGYFGAIAPWLWYECIEDLSRLRPEIGFVFIGPDYYGGTSKLSAYKNVLYLGAVDYKILPAYAEKFDICFIPFRPGDIAKATSPLKLFEYFALEKPVVATADMDECTAYPEVFRGNSAAELSDAIDKALLVKDAPSFVARLRELAEHNDWMQRARVYESVYHKQV